jgi:uncharacterized phage infection (PIP) family protein YhgE
VYQSVLCPACGRWAGPLPRGVIAIGVLSIIGSAISFLGSLVILALADTSPLFVSAFITSVMAVLQAFFAINLLRLRQWAYAAFRVLLIIGVSLALLLSVTTSDPPPSKSVTQGRQNI